MTDALKVIVGCTITMAIAIHETAANITQFALPFWFAITDTFIAGTMSVAGHGADLQVTGRATPSVVTDACRMIIIRGIGMTNPVVVASAFLEGTFLA